MSHHGGSSHSTDGQDEKLLLSFWRAATVHVTTVCGLDNIVTPVLSK